MKSKKGYLIAIEGIDGAGKTTQIRLLTDTLSKSYPKKVVVLRETSSTDIGQMINESFRQKDIDSLTRFFLICAARQRLTESMIKPLLQDGLIVICDRYRLSGAVYSTAGLGLDTWLVDCILSYSLQPDLTIILDLPPEVAMSRISTPDSFEDKVEKLEAYRQKYLSEFRHSNIKAYLIDANRPQDEVYCDIEFKVLSCLSLYFKVA